MPSLRKFVWRRALAMPLKNVFASAFFFAIAGSVTIIALIVLSSTYLGNQRAAQSNAAAAAAQAVGTRILNEMTRLLRSDLDRARIAGDQLPLHVTDAASLVDVADARQRYNETLLAAFMPRCAIAGDVGGFGWTFIFNHTSPDRRQYTLQLYADHLRDDKRECLVSWADDNNTQVVHAFLPTDANVTSPGFGPARLSSEVAYTAEAIWPTVGDGEWEEPFLWQARDGNVFWAFAYDRVYMAGDHVQVFIQSFPDAGLWGGMLQQLLHVADGSTDRAAATTTEDVDVTSALWVVMEDARVVATTHDPTLQYYENCAFGNPSTFAESCFSQPLAQLGGVVDPLYHTIGPLAASMLEEFQAMRAASGNTEAPSALDDLVGSVDDVTTSVTLVRHYRVSDQYVEHEETASSSRNRLLMATPVIMRSGMRLTAVWSGLGPADADAAVQHQTIVFSLLGTFVMVGLMMTVMNMYGILHPVRSTVLKLDTIARLDLDAIADMLHDDAEFEAQEGEGGRDGGASTTTCDGLTLEGQLLRHNTRALAAAVMSFARFMPVDVVRDLLSTGTIARVELKHVHLHVMFTDIQGFTSISETLGQRYPNLLSRLLNRFFSVVCDSVADTGGTVDKFIGDCVMAFWGAPTPHSFSATAALLSALDLVETLKANAGSNADVYFSPRLRDTPSTVLPFPITVQDACAAPVRAGGATVATTPVGSRSPTPTTLEPHAAGACNSTEVTVESGRHTVDASIVRIDVPPSQPVLAAPPVPVTTGGSAAAVVPSFDAISSHRRYSAPTATATVSTIKSDDLEGVSHQDRRRRRLQRLRNRNSKNTAIVLDGGTLSVSCGATERRESNAEPPNLEAAAWGSALPRTPGRAPLQRPGNKTARGSAYVEPQLLQTVQFAPLRVRVGVCGGLVHVGNMGCEERLSYTAIGDAVNTASRLEGFVKHMEGPCDIICGTGVLAEAHPALIARYVGPVRLVGKADPIAVSQVLAVAAVTAHLAPSKMSYAYGAATIAHDDVADATPTGSQAAFHGPSANAVQRLVDAHPAAFGEIDGAALIAMAHFNSTIRAAHVAAAAARQRSDVVLSSCGVHPFDNSGSAAALGDATARNGSSSPCLSRPARLGAAYQGILNDPATADAVNAVMTAHEQLPPALQRLCAPQDSLRAAASATGIIECGSK
jgi:class 3 adenylate cyclase